MKRTYELRDGKLVQTGGPPEDAERGAQHIAEICESRQCPGLRTDTAWFTSDRTVAKHVQCPRRRKQLQENARRLGITLTGNEQYQPSLARFPGDPRACISQSQGLGHMKALIEARGTGVEEGPFTVKAREPDNPPPRRIHKLSPRLVREFVQRELAENPDSARLDRRELVEKVIDRHGPKD